MLTDVQLWSALDRLRSALLHDTSVCSGCPLRGQNPFQYSIYYGPRMKGSWTMRVTGSIRRQHFYHQFINTKGQLCRSMHVIRVGYKTCKSDHTGLRCNPMFRQYSGTIAGHFEFLVDRLFSNVLSWYVVPLGLMLMQLSRDTCGIEDFYWVGNYYL